MQGFATRFYSNFAQRIDVTLKQVRFVRKVIDIAWLAGSILKSQQTGSTLAAGVEVGGRAVRETCVAAANRR